MTDPLTIGFKVRDSFFDRAAILSRMTAAERRAYSKAGAFVRSTARQSIRKPRRMRLAELSERSQAAFEHRRRVAVMRGDQPPQLPYAASRPGEPPRSPTDKIRTIFFAYEPDRHNVVIGPIKLTGTRSDTAPSSLEKGGTESMFGKPITIRERPFMRPALEKERNKVPGLFAGQL